MAEEQTGDVARQFGRYELLYRFAVGGMASLFLARLRGEEGFERLVAVKVIHDHLILQPQFVKMFIDEARVASRISHPNVAMTLDLGKVGAKHFIAMEYVEGESLAALLRRTRPPINHCVRIISDAAMGLHAAHELCDSHAQPLGVVHRDVSPQNILISYQGAVKVVDFGVARVRGSLHTTSGEIKGKFSYMSPEQFSAPEIVDRRTDVFALGVVLYESTTRKRLFKADSQAATVSRVLGGRVPPPSRLVSDYPADLERIVLQALSRDPAKRHPTAQALHDDLERVIIDSGEAVSGMTVGTMMQEVFADRIAEKKTLRTQDLTEDELTVPTVDMVSGTSLELRSAASVEPPRRRGGLMAALMVLLLASVGAVVVFVLVGDEPSPRAETPKKAAPASRPTSPVQPTPRMVTITAKALPANATLRLDGRRMDNPFEVQRAAGDGTAALVVTAPGHRPQRFQVPLSRGGTWTIGLVPEEAPPKRLDKHVEKRPKKPPPRRKRGKTNRGTGYLDNPYQ